MDRIPGKLLLTGPPGCGKTTVVRQVVGRLGDLCLAGFYTQEMREHGRRVGFEAVGLGGQRGILAHVEIHGRHRVGRYGVNVQEFERILRAEMREPAAGVDLFVVDEIGKMECLSYAFVEAVTRALDGPVPVLATVAATGSGFVAAVKARQDVEIVSVTPANRGDLPDELVQRIRAR